MKKKIVQIPFEELKTLVHAAEFYYSDYNNCPQETMEVIHKWEKYIKEDISELEKRAIFLYKKYIENFPVSACVFPKWENLSFNDQNYWFVEAKK